MAEDGADEVMFRNRHRAKSWLGKRTGLELSLLILFILTLIVATTFLIVIAAGGPRLCAIAIPIPEDYDSVNATSVPSTSQTIATSQNATTTSESLRTLVTSEGGVSTSSKPEETTTLSTPVTVRSTTPFEFSGEPGCYNSRNEEVCQTPECVLASARVLEAVDTKTNPCDDFYQFACGRWIERNVIPEDASSVTVFSRLKDELQVQLKQLLDVPVSEEDGESVKKAKYLFMSCMNESAINERDLEPLNKFLEDIGGWPVLNQIPWDESKFDLSDQLVKMWLYHNRLLIHHAVGPDGKNSDTHVIQINQPALGMPSRDYYLKGRSDPMLKAYEECARELANVLGSDKVMADTEVAEMIDFEIQLANISTPEERLRDISANYHKMSVQDLMTNFSGFDWKRYFTTLYSHVDITINDTTQVVVHSQEYIQRVIPLLNKTKKRTVANYLVWRILFHRLKSLPFKYREIQNKFRKALYGSGMEKPRWRTCVRYANDNLGMAVGKLFVSKYFHGGAKHDAEEMIMRIRNTFVKRLDNVDWMDETTKEAARQKARGIIERIGYPAYIMNNTALDEEYAMFGMMKPDKLFENVIEILRRSAIENLKKVGKRVEKNKWPAHPAEVNAYYSASSNNILFPAGILQPPFYAHKGPNYLNYGAVGVVVGHEISHGFDDEGRQYDKNGNLVQWWSPEASDNFEEKAKCIIDQYQNYTVEAVKMNLNGIMTQGENIADNGGLKQSYQAYRELIRENGREEPRLPGVTMTNDQLFFLNFAQIWCESRRPQDYLQIVQAGRHNPGKYRVIGTLSNSDDFARSFNCPRGSTMNPVKKCTVW